MRGNETKGADGSGLEETGRIIGASFSRASWIGLRDSKRCTLGSDDADEPGLGQSGDREALCDSFQSSVPRLHSARGLQGECVWA